MTDRTARSRDHRSGATRRRPSFLSAFGLACLVAQAGQAQTAGLYDVAGANPDGGTYRGVAVVERAYEGEANVYRIVWTIGGVAFVGVGLAEGGDETARLIVGYTADGTPGVGLYAPTETGWSGRWSFEGAAGIGGEIWTRRAPAAPPTSQDAGRPDVGIDDPPLDER